MDKIKKIVEENQAVVLYFSHDECNVCKVLKPKIAELLSQKYPKCRLVYVNIKEDAEAAAAFQAFTVPTVLIYFEGKEYYRFSRNIGLNQFDEAIRRPYQLLFD